MSGRSQEFVVWIQRSSVDGSFGRFEFVPQSGDGVQIGVASRIVGQWREHAENHGFDGWGSLLGVVQFRKLG